MKEHNLEAFYKYYSNATKEQAIQDMFLDNCNLQQEIERLENIIKEVREKIEMKIKGYKEIINTLIYSSVENKRYEISELKYRIGEQEELLEILDKENKEC